MRGAFREVRAYRELREAFAASVVAGHYGRTETALDRRCYYLWLSVDGDLAQIAKLLRADADDGRVMASIDRRLRKNSETAWQVHERGDRLIKMRRFVAAAAARAVADAARRAASSLGR